MPTFVLTARQQIDRPNGFHIDRGQQVTIDINKAGITPNNLFNNSRCASALAQQFKMKNIDVPKTDVVYTKGVWDIKMR